MEHLCAKLFYAAVGGVAVYILNKTEGNWMLKILRGSKAQIEGDLRMSLKLQFTEDINLVIGLSVTGERVFPPAEESVLPPAEESVLPPAEDNSIHKKLLEELKMLTLKDVPSILKDKKSIFPYKSSS